MRRETFYSQFRSQPARLVSRPSRRVIVPKPVLAPRQVKVRIVQPRQPRQPVKIGGLRLETMPGMELRRQREAEEARLNVAYRKVHPHIASIFPSPKYKWAVTNVETGKTARIDVGGLRKLPGAMTPGQLRRKSYSRSYGVLM